MDDFDIVIVGAGLSGLSLAHSILKRNAELDVLILEAKDDVGGRVAFSNLSESFYYTSHQTHVIRLLHALRIASSPGRRVVGKKRVFFTKRGPVVKISTYQAAQVHHFLQTIHRYSLHKNFKTYNQHEDAKRLAQMSVDEFISQTVFSWHARSVCRALISRICGIRNLKRVSALWFLVMLNGTSGFYNLLKATVVDENCYFVNGGMKKLADELKRRILSQGGRIMCDERVVKVQSNEDQICVYTTTNNFKCTYVVIATPPPESNSIIIEPPLPGDLAQSQSSFAHEEPIYFRATYDSPFWASEYDGSVLTAPNANTVLNFAFEKDRELIGSLNESNSSTRKLPLFETLRSCFKNTDAHDYLTYEEYTLKTIGTTCVMSVMPPSHINNYIHIKDRHVNNIFFTASEYATRWPGTVNGAIETGEMTASLILSDARPQAVHFEELHYFEYTKINDELFPGPAVAAVQYSILILNICIFISFLRKAYD